MKTYTQLSALAVSVVLIFSACKKENSVNPSPSSPDTSKQGSMQVKMTDGPANYAALFMDITGVDVYSEEQGWVALSKEQQKIDVLALNNGVTVNLTPETTVSAGTYTKIKIRFSENNSIAVNSGSTGAIATIGLKWDGPREAEVRIDQKITGGAKTEVLLDFQVAQSIFQDASNYIIRPMIAEVKDASTGIKGMVKGSGAASVILTNGIHNYDTYINANGEFLIRGVEPGKYDMIVSPLTNLQGTLLSPKRIEGLVIAKGKISETTTVQF
ncbi:MAG: DUF4382 domain-containing protein [Bacteroidia bacterium]